MQLQTPQKTTQLKTILRASIGCALLVAVFATGGLRSSNAQGEATSTAPAEATVAATSAATPTAIVCPALPASAKVAATAEATAQATSVATATATPPGYLGIGAEDNGDGCGVLVLDIDPNGPAAKASLQTGDLIFGADGFLTKNVDALRGYIISLPIGAKVELYIRRGVEIKTLQVTLSARPTDAETPVAPTAEATLAPTAEATAMATSVATAQPTSQPTAEATPAK